MLGNFLLSRNKLYDSIVSVSAIIGITAIEVIAITKGLNGAYLAISVATIAGLGGFALRNVIPKK